MKKKDWQDGYDLRIGSQEEKDMQKRRDEREERLKALYELDEKPKCYTYDVELSDEEYERYCQAQEECYRKEQQFRKEHGLPPLP